MDVRWIFFAIVINQMRKLDDEIAPAERILPYELSKQLPLGAKNPAGYFLSKTAEAFTATCRSAYNIGWLLSPTQAAESFVPISV